MSPAELHMPGSPIAVESTSKGYSGRNMTLPASWWTSSSLFQLERRAIFAKVFPLFDLVDGRLGCMQRILRISRNRGRIVLSALLDILSF
jgi:hypothetical protein